MTPARAGARAARQSGEHWARAARAGRLPERGSTGAGATALRLVGDPTSASRRARATRVLTIALTGLAAVGLFFIVYVHVLLSQGQMRLDRLDTQAETLGSQNERLRVEVAELESPARVVADARKRLGMVPPAVVTPLASPPAPQ